MLLQQRCTKYDPPSQCRTSHMKKQTKKELLHAASSVNMGDLVQQMKILRPTETPRQQSATPKTNFSAAYGRVTYVDAARLAGSRFECEEVTEGVAPKEF